MQVAFALNGSNSALSSISHISVGPIGLTQVDFDMHGKCCRDYCLTRRLPTMKGSGLSFVYCILFNALTILSPASVDRVFNLLGNWNPTILSNSVFPDMEGQYI